MTKKMIFGLLAAIMLLALPACTFARGGHGGGYHGRHHHGHSHSRWSFNFGFVVAPPPVYPVVVYPPRQVVVVDPTPVYVAPAPVYVTPAPTVIEKTVVVQQPVVQETAVVWIANDNGSKTEIKLIRTNEGGYKGPRGEYYATMPTEEDLKVLYGVRTVQAKPSNFTVWIVNDNGSQTPITLTPSGSGFVGPSGEYYPTMPTEEQLKAQYGLRTNVPAENTVTVWVSENLPIVLNKSGDEYIGPKGEHYESVPTKDQLALIYGHKAEKIDNGNTVVWLTAPDGTKTPITLQKQGSGYVGPAGEKYNTLPTEDQLKALYGTSTDTETKELNFEITKDDGTKTLVTLKKDGSEFIGPKGERYGKMPTEEQLRLIYGK
ncbi:MAG: hypothetical protein A2Y12_02210 [Planctomycetes bacterium GWF2_42_9]|nr:MAG: hypothetical protein A2Y12_02210 [Planctomycetes bacterium GWF2_42_9]